MDARNMGISTHGSGYVPMYTYIYFFTFACVRERLRVCVFVLYIDITYALIHLTSTFTLPFSSCCFFFSFFGDSLESELTKAYSTMAANTNTMHVAIHTSIAFA